MPSSSFSVQVERTVFCSHGRWRSRCETLAHANARPRRPRSRRAAAGGRPGGSGASARAQAARPAASPRRPVFPRAPRQRGQPLGHRRLVSFQGSRDSITQQASPMDHPMRVLGFWLCSNRRFLEAGGSHVYQFEHSRVAPPPRRPQQQRSAWALARTPRRRPRGGRDVIPVNGRDWTPRRSGRWSSDVRVYRCWCHLFLLLGRIGVGGHHRRSYT